MSRSRVLVTGSAGLIGTALCAALACTGYRVARLDLCAVNAADAGDVRDAERVRAALEGCDGVIHLAAVSRVAWAERDPQLCWDTNVRGLANVIAAAAGGPHAPWLVFVSSREVYGQAGNLPASESAPQHPVNVYGRSKVEGERLVRQATVRGLRGVIVRLSNVYGRVGDHADRVVPAFARAAAQGGVMRVEGRSHMFDFTHVDDVVAGLLRVAERLVDDPSLVLPPIHFVSGRAHTLGELAALANELGGRRARLVESAARDFDVARFCGCGARADGLLGWSPRIALNAGLGRLIDDFRVSAGIALTQRAPSLA